MHRLLLFSIGVVVGIVAGVTGALLIRGDRTDPFDRPEVCLLEVLFDSSSVLSGNNEAWQRRIDTHIAQIRFTGVMATVLNDIDVRATSWFNEHEPEDRMRALQETLRVEQVPETSLIQIWFPSSSPVESATIANVVARSYTSSFRADRMQRHYEEMELLSTLEGHVERKAADRTLELQQLEMGQADTNRIRAELERLGDWRHDLERQRQEKWLCAMSPEGDSVRLVKAADTYDTAIGR